MDHMDHQSLITVGLLRIRLVSFHDKESESERERWGWEVGKSDKDRKTEVDVVLIQAVTVITCTTAHTD